MRERATTEKKLMDTTQAEKALERQLQEVTTRLYSAGRLGERLLSQKKQIEEQLEVLEGVNRIPENLKAKLQELEREFEEIKKESNDSWLLLGSLDEVVGYGFFRRVFKAILGV